MRRLNPISIAALARDPHNYDPAPFPGRFPIRWYIKLTTDHGKTLFRYLGKPNLYIARKVVVLAGTRQGAALIYEFDRKNLIASVEHFIPSNLTTGFSNAELLYRYRPTTSLTAVSWLLGARKLHAIINTKRIIAYIPKSSNAIMLEAWQSWIRNPSKPKQKKSISMWNITSQPSPW